MRGLPARLRELALLASDGGDDLRETLRESAASLGELLGADEQRLLRLLEHDEHVLREELLRLISRARDTALRELAADREHRAVLAAQRLATTAHWLDTGVEVDPGLLLGDVLADARKPWLGLVVDDRDIIMSRARLLRAGRALRPFRDLRVLVAEGSIRLRWRGGRGGLNLRSQTALVS